LRIRPIGSLREGEPAAVVGVVLQRVENYVVLDDGTGRARVYSDQVDPLSPGDFVLAVGVVAAAGRVVEIQSEALTKVAGMDPDLLKETLKLVAEVEGRDAVSDESEGRELDEHER